MCVRLLPSPLTLAASPVERSLLQSPIAMHVLPFLHNYYHLYPTTTADYLYKLQLKILLLFIVPNN